MVEDIKCQLEYRRKQKSGNGFFYNTLINTEITMFLLSDDNKGNFTVARKLDVNEKSGYSSFIRCCAVQS